MIRGQTVTLVIPCKNEAEAIVGLLRQVPRAVDEVIVVDNNSSDQTRRVARRLGARVVTELRHDHGIGYGYAHQRGLELATGQIVVTMDGDNTYPVQAIKPAVQYLLSQGLDMVSCNRFPLKNQQAISKVRQLGVWVLNTQVRLLYGYPMQDILSGMWVLNRTAIKTLKLESGGWNLSPEIKLQALANPQLQFGEYHIDHTYRQGESKQRIWLTGFDHLFYILGRRLTKDNPFKSRLKSLPLSQLLPRLPVINLD